MEFRIEGEDLDFRAFFTHLLEENRKDSLETRDLVSLLEENSLEGWVLQKSYPKQNIQAELVSVENRGDVQLRTYHEYEILYDVSEYKRADEIKTIDRIKEKRFRRQYTEETRIRNPLTRVFDQFEISGELKGATLSHGRNIDVYC